MTSVLKTTFGKMVQKHKVQGYESFLELMKQFDGKKESIFVYFSGTKDENGQSWCPACVRCWPAVEEAIEKMPEGHFIYVDVGDRPTWKDQKNPFRSHPNTQLNVIPALLKWKSPQRLDGDQCGKVELLEMIFSEDD